MADLFISYARSDRNRVELLAEALEACGLSIWWDRRLVGGDEFSADIEHELGAAGAVLVAWSSASTGSRWVKDEASVAADAGKLIALSLDGSEAPIGFRQFHCTDLSRWDGQAKGEAFEEVFAAVRARLGVEADSPEAESDRERSIAVLPFDFVGGDPQQGYVADGLTDEIISKLSRLPALRVTSRTSSMVFKSVNREARTIAAQLKVTHLLEGTTRVAGDALRVSARLIEPRRDEQLWAAQFDGTLEDVFSIQEQIAKKIVDALELHLTPEQKQSLANRSVEDAVAWRLMFQARQEAFRWRRDAIDRAVTLLQRAITIAGDNPQLLGALGRTWLQYREAGLDLSDRPLEEAENCAGRILARDPTALEGLQLKGWLAYSRGEVGKALQFLRAALKDDPDDADTLALLVNCLLIAGLTDESRDPIDRLQLIDPLTPLTRCMPGFRAALEGRFVDATGPYLKMLAMDPENPFGRLFCVWVHALNQEPEAAAALFAEFPPEAMEHPAAQIAGLFVPDDGRPASVSPQTEGAAHENEMLARTLSQGLAARGDYEGAERWLNVAMQRGFTNYPYVAEFDPFFAPLKGRSGFDSLLREMKQRWETLKNESPA